jgi:GAF domain-containing protein
MCLGAAPQGVTVRVDAPVVTGASKANAEAIAAAVRAELTAQGYGVLKPGDAGAMAAVTGTLTKDERGLLLVLTLTRVSDGAVLDDERETVKDSAGLAAAATEATRRLATEIRLTWGVRTKLKLK